MFDQLFQKPEIIRRYLNAPLLEDRLQYLTYRAKHGTKRDLLRTISYYQMIAITYLRLKHNERIITIKELENAAKHWAHHEMKLLRKGFSYAACKDRFIRHAKNWLKFLGRIDASRCPVPTQVTEYVDYLRKEKGLSEATISHRLFLLKKFFNQSKDKPEQLLAHLTAAHLDALLMQELRQGAYSRRTISDHCSNLRMFLHYAERRDWCRRGIADSIQSPHLYKHEALPSGPSLEEIQRLINTTEGDHPLDIRDRAIILLLAIYGFRASEVRLLRLEDINWEQDTLRVKHSKHGPTQQFPLTQTVGHALVRYIKEVRPRGSTHREIFLTIRAPFRPLNLLSNLIYARWRRIGIDIKHHGTHSLRHACATRLINQGVSLKTIADQLGHRDLETTRVYAKVDLPRLREVGNFNLRGVL